MKTLIQTSYRSLLIISILTATLLVPRNSAAQCNTNTSICSLTSNPTFNFVNPGNAVSSCLDFYGPSVAYIMLNITTSGNLNLLINGNSSYGYLDVAVFNVPNGVSPCSAIQNMSNELGCNYASSSNGCNQFGNSFPCSSSVPAPAVTAGQTLMIIVENWSGSSSNFTLQLGSTPGSAQTGAPNATVNPAGPFCLTAPPFQLTATNQGGIWSGPGTSSSGMFNPATAGPGTHTITYSIGQSPCNSTSTTNVTVNAAGTLAVTPSTTICPGGSTTLTASGASTYSWTPSTGLSATTGGTVTASPSTTTTYTVTGTSSGCTATGTTTVTIGASPVVNVSSNSPLCEGETLSLSAGDLNNSPATYNWTGPNGFSATTQNPVVPNVTPGNAGAYTVQITFGNGCSNSGTTSLEINPTIYAEITPAGPFCRDASPVFLTADIQGGVWSGPGITDPYTGAFDPAQADTGINEIAYAIQGPCGGTTYSSIIINEIPVVSFMADKLSGCSPLTINFSNNSIVSGQSMQWDFGDGSSSGATPTGQIAHQFINPGCYDITLSSTVDGCTGSQTLQNLICVEHDPVAEFTTPKLTTTLFYPTFSFTNQSTNAAAYSWTFGDGSGSTEVNPTHTYGEIAGSYPVILTAISAAGCIDTTTLIVKIEEEQIFYIPNAFTPDGDEFNNTFKPVFTSGFDPKNYSLALYNRWGEIMFESKNADFGWDGTYGGEPCQSGTYIWVIGFKDSDSDQRFQYQGHISILR